MDLFGINGGEFLVLIVVGIVVLGPERLPEYAGKLARLVKQVRAFATNAQDQLKEQMGPEFGDIDWKQYDPRRYDPRRIVREALLDDGSAQPHGSTAASDVGPDVAGAASDAAGGASAASSEPTPPAATGHGGAAPQTPATASSAAPVAPAATPTTSGRHPAPTASAWTPAPPQDARGGGATGGWDVDAT